MTPSLGAMCICSARSTHRAWCPSARTAEPRVSWQSIDHVGKIRAINIMSEASICSGVPRGRGRRPRRRNVREHALARSRHGQRLGRELAERGEHALAAQGIRPRRSRCTSSPSEAFVPTLWRGQSFSAPAQERWTFRRRRQDRVYRAASSAKTRPVAGMNVYLRLRSPRNQRSGTRAHRAARPGPWRRFRCPGGGGGKAG